MPLGEIIAEIGLRIVLEIIVFGLAYWTGFIALKILSLGTLNLAPMKTMGRKNRGKTGKKQEGWRIWFFQRQMRGKELRMEITCLVGILIWILVGFCAFLATRSTDEPEHKTSFLLSGERKLAPVSGAPGRERPGVPSRAGRARRPRGKS